MRQYMLSAQQTLPNKKRQAAEFEYMNSMSGVTQERKEVMQNDLYAEAKKNFYQWMVLKKKMVVLDEAEKLIDLMIKTAEIRYKNNTGDITAYYKAKAALGNLHTIRVQLQNDVVQKRIALNTVMHHDRMYRFEIATSYVIEDFSDLEIDSASLTNTRSDIAV